MQLQGKWISTTASLELSMDRHLFAFITDGRVERELDVKERVDKSDSSAR